MELPISAWRKQGKNENPQNDWFPLKTGTRNLSNGS
jgi:hypothetical protein